MQKWKAHSETIFDMAFLDNDDFIISFAKGDFPKKWDYSSKKGLIDEKNPEILEFKLDNLEENKDEP